MFAAVQTSGDKGLLPLGTTTMLGHVIARLAPQVGPMVLNANGDPARFASFGLPVVADPIDGFVGPLAGILAGLLWVQQHAPEITHAISVSADVPFLPSDLVERLMAASSKAPTQIAIAQSVGKESAGDQSVGDMHPVIGCWPVAHAGHLEAALRDGVRKVLRWTDVHGTIPVAFPMLDIGGEPVDPFFNANTPAELETAQRLMARLAT